MTSNSVNKDCADKDCVNKTATITYLGFLKWLKFPSLELDLKLAHVTNVTSNRVNKDFTNISNWQLCKQDCRNFIFKISFLASSRTGHEDCKCDQRDQQLR